MDDTLVTGTPERLQWLKSRLEKEYGKLKEELNAFRHFGVDVTRDTKSLHVEASQKAYVANLKPITLDRSRGDGRTVDTLATSAEITEARSLISGIAWVGVTHPGAQAAASLLQHYLPTPTVGQILMCNAFLAQLQADYQPLIFRHGLSFNRLRVVTVTDSSLGNAEKYSQGGFMHFLSNDDVSCVNGNSVLIYARSGRSKRVASSTMSAETLHLVSGVE